MATENEDAFIESLRELRAACQTCNKHEQVIVLIHAFISIAANQRQARAKRHAAA